MRSTLPSVLRVHPEPCAFIDERSVHDALTADPQGYLAFLEDRLRKIAADEAKLQLPAKQVFSDQEGDFRVMPCVYHEGDQMLKTVKIVGTNNVQEKVPDQYTVGRAMRLDPRENFVTHIFEACLLSSARSGSCAAAAVNKLARRRRRIAVVGTGRVGFYTALYCAYLEGVEQIVLLDQIPGRADSAAQDLLSQLPSSVRCEAGESLQQETYDVVILATTSREPVLRQEETSADLVVSLGADTHTQRELDRSWAEVSDIYVDSLDGVHVGDLFAWMSEGLVKLEQLVDLLELLRDGPKDTPGKKRLFISTGSALFDNLTIGYLLEGKETGSASSRNQVSAESTPRTPKLSE